MTEYKTSGKIPMSAPSMQAQAQAQQAAALAAQQAAAAAAAQGDDDDLDDEGDDDDEHQQILSLVFRISDKNQTDGKT